MDLTKKEQLINYIVGNLSTSAKEEINNHNLLELKQYLHSYDLQYFFLDAGIEHYKLLNHISILASMWLSNQVEPGDLLKDYIQILDLGTQFGGSSIALSNSTKVKVTSYDLEDKRDGKEWPSNIKFILGNCIELGEDFHKYDIIMMDVNHDGLFEHEFFNHLDSIKWKGLVILDDIHLNDAMKTFWSSITYPKYDLSFCGHWSGTGLVAFGLSEKQS